MFRVIIGEPSTVPFCNWQILKPCPNLTALFGSPSPPLIGGHKFAVKNQSIPSTQTCREVYGFI